MKKSTRILMLVSIGLLFSFGIVLAVGDILTTSSVTWVSPPGNYVYQVTTNSLTAPEALCLQYRTDKGSGWTWYYEDLCTSVDNTNWVCTIPGPLTSGYNYQWYIDGDGDCTDGAGVDGNDRDWTPNSPGWQPTNPVTAVAISSLSGRTPLALTMVFGAVVLGGVFVWQRKR